MADVTVKRVDEMESIWGGSFVRARASLGAAEDRNITTGAEGVQLLVIGGTPGAAYEPLPIVELGGPESL